MKKEKKLRSCLTKTNQDLFVITVKLDQNKSPTKSPLPVSPMVLNCENEVLSVWDEDHNESLGCLENIQNNSKLSAVRTLMGEEGIEIGDVVFVKPNDKEVMKEDENSVCVSECLRQISNNKIGFYMRKSLGLCISFFDPVKSESRGVLEEIDGNMTLLKLREEIEKVFDSPIQGFKFMSPNNDPYSKLQEESKLVKHITYNKDGKIMINIRGPLK